MKGFRITHLDDHRIKRIHVNKSVIRVNMKMGANEPVLTCKVGKQNIYGHEVEIHGKSTMIYRPEKPLSCGAQAWIETKAPVTITNRSYRAVRR